MASSTVHCDDLAPSPLSASPSRPICSLPTITSKNQVDHLGGRGGGGPTKALGALGFSKARARGSCE
eukprot:scaffold103249_cov34-Tisochrysis_lutea.AAC.1